jgi:hypothetical protein
MNFPLFSSRSHPPPRSIVPHAYPARAVGLDARGAARGRPGSVLPGRGAGRAEWVIWISFKLRLLRQVREAETLTPTTLVGESGCKHHSVAMGLCAGELTWQRDHQWEPTRRGRGPLVSNLPVLILRWIRSQHARLEHPQHFREECVVFKCWPMDHRRIIVANRI